MSSLETKPQGQFKDFATIAIHAGQPSDPHTGAVVVPVTRSATYQWEALGVFKHEYSRSDNPTRLILEKNLAALESGKHGLAFASGSAASHNVFATLKAGDHVVVSSDIYGGTYRQFEKVFAQWDLTHTYVNSDDPADYGRAVTPHTKLIWTESPTNPLLKLIDLRGLANVAKAHGVLLAVDNTFASPYFQKPLLLGADIVVHSLTKYIGGHSDVVGGAIITNDDALHAKLKFFQNGIGAILGPDDSALVLRGIKTLKVRLEEHQKNALAIARYLTTQPLVEKVYYPGLETDPYHALAKQQMTGFGGVVSFEIKGDRDTVNTFVSALKIIKLAESLGGVESLICYPPAMSHGGLTEAERLERGIKPNLLRLSVGIEGLEDLIPDLTQAFAKVGEK